MTCRDVSEFLMDYLDGALPTGQRAVFERHLAACPECRVYLRSYQVTIELGRAALCTPDHGFADPPPDELVAAILASRRAEVGRRECRRPAVEDVPSRHRPPPSEDRRPNG